MGDMLAQRADDDSSSMIPACFACHVDCATGCHTDDQPFDHPYAYHPPNFEEDNSTAGDDEQMLSPKFDDSQENVNFDKEGEEDTRGPEQEGSAVMRFVLWVLDVKTDTGV